MKREHLYVTRKHPCVWLMVLCMAASVVATLLTVQGTISTRLGIWCGIVLPCVAAILFALIAVCAGGEMLYRTAVPVWIWGICLAIQSGKVIVWIVCLLFCFGYTHIISGKAKKVWLLPLCVAAFGGCLYLQSLSDALFAAGMILLWSSIKVHTDGKWHPTWGDRIDGRRVRTAQVM